ncbi:MAG: EamA family transporter [Burkholderiales bacterium]|jgi:drug/metabolite transporter (DMT)-like permease|nr:MAG: EamA family transporter [Burkholderiales bacterium]
MSLAVSIAVLLAALLHASWNAMIKGGGDVLHDTAGIVVGAMLIGLPFLFVLPVPPPAAWPFIAASVAAHLAYYWLMVSAYRAGDLSLVYPLMRGVAPLITALAGVFLLGELPPPVAWLGMLLVSGGVFLLGYRALGHAPSRAAVVFALANAVVIALYTLIDGRGARVSGNAWSYIVWLFVLDGIPFSLWMLATHRASFLGHLRRRSRRALVGGGLSAAAYAISVWAMTKAPVALVASLRETSVLFATLIGARLLRERLTARRWSGVVAVVLGVLALKAA